jgi:hypothetical protein
MALRKVGTLIPPDGMGMLKVLSQQQQEFWRSHTAVACSCPLDQNLCPPKAELSVLWRQIFCLPQELGHGSALRDKKMQVSALMGVLGKIHECMANYCAVAPSGGPGNRVLALICMLLAPRGRLGGCVCMPIPRSWW